LNRWETCSRPTKFMNPFPWLAGPLPARIRYGDVASLESSLMQCRNIVYWDQVSSFPPRPADCFHDWSSVTRFVVQPWYRLLQIPNTGYHLLL
jgi:hypothetical protein